MKLKEWMSDKGFKPPSLATAMNTKFGTTFSKTSIYRILDEHNPSLELAVAIDKFTDGMVPPLDLLSDSVLLGTSATRVTLDKKTDRITVEEEDFSDLFD